MENIKKIVIQQEVTFDELFQCLQEIEKSGNVFILKIDGERETDRNTVMITFPNDDREMIRHDGADIKVAIKKALSDFILS